MELDLDLEYLCHMLEDNDASDEEIEDFLEHFGVKGMRWGQRKSRQEGGSGRKSQTTAAGKARFGRNLTLGIIGGAAAGLTLAALAKSTMPRSSQLEVARMVRDLT